MRILFLDYNTARHNVFRISAQNCNVDYFTSLSAGNVTTILSRISTYDLIMSGYGFGANWDSVNTSNAPTTDRNFTFFFNQLIQNNLLVSLCPIVLHTRNVMGAREVLALADSVGFTKIRHVPYAYYLFRQANNDEGFEFSDSMMMTPDIV